MKTLKKIPVVINSTYWCRSARSTWTAARTTTNAMAWRQFQFANQRCSNWQRPQIVKQRSSTISKTYCPIQWVCCIGCKPWGQQQSTHVCQHYLPVGSCQFLHTVRLAWAELYPILTRWASGVKMNLYDRSKSTKYWSQHRQYSPPHPASSIECVDQNVPSARHSSCPFLRPSVAWFHGGPSHWWFRWW